MKKLSIKLFWAVALFVTLAARESAADKLCIQNTVNKKTLKVTTRSVIAAVCPGGYTALADTSAFRGPTGAQGPAGLLNLAACRTVSNTCNHSSGVNICVKHCDAGEFILQYSGVFSSTPFGGQCLPEGNPPSPFASIYSNGLGAGVSMTTAGNCAYQAIVSAVCCPIS